MSRLCCSGWLSVASSQPCSQCIHSSRPMHATRCILSLPWRPCHVPKCRVFHMLSLAPVFAVINKCLLPHIVCREPLLDSCQTVVHSLPSKEHQTTLTISLNINLMRNTSQRDLRMCCLLPNSAVQTRQWNSTLVANHTSSNETACWEDLGLLPVNPQWAPKHDAYCSLAERGCAYQKKNKFRSSFSTAWRQTRTQ